MLRKISLGLALAAMLTAMLVANHSAIASPDMQTITLNTGFNHDTQYKYAIGPLDDFWTLTQDPITGTSEPRSANTITKHSAWNAAQPDSQWISYVNNGSTGILQGPYVYQKCFCMTKALWDNKAAIQQSSFDVSVMADDAFSLSLNGNNLLSSGGGQGGFSGPPATLTIKGNKLAQLLHPGRNCLSVTVTDLGGVITGFDLVGSLTSTGIDGIAKGSKVQTQFNSCSSCKNRRGDEGRITEEVPTRQSN